MRPNKHKRQSIHVKSQVSHPILQLHTPQGQVAVYSEGFLSSDPSVGATPSHGKKQMLDSRRQTALSVMVPIRKHNQFLELNGSERAKMSWHLRYDLTMTGAWCVNEECTKCITDSLTSTGTHTPYPEEAFRSSPEGSKKANSQP